MKQDIPINTIKLAAPARRALHNANILFLTDLINYTEHEITLLHGIGQNALNLIKQAMDQNAINFKKQDV
ncbi:DNA-directed RNA polymerase subunit alpha C-terminal domain-containing protein [Pedobacter sp.]|uniref:DNA-directed RNA polymerase subunit alpha C-terminal domain-containing protein n=1 Tax=Pedobacter sp. TaxID=1411316 RepID=UPI003BA96FDA